MAKVETRRVQVIDTTRIGTRSTAGRHWVPASDDETRIMQWEQPLKRFLQLPQPSVRVADHAN